LVEGAANLLARLVQIFIELVRGFFGVSLYLLGGLTGLFPSSLLFGRRTRGKRNGEGDEKGWFHTSASSNSLAN
jgi:hypothetical protein